MECFVKPHYEFMSEYKEYFGEPVGVFILSSNLRCRSLYLNSKIMLLDRQVASKKGYRLSYLLGQPISVNDTLSSRAIRSLMKMLFMRC